MGTFAVLTAHCYPCVGHTVCGMLGLNSSTSLYKMARKLCPIHCHYVLWPSTDTNIRLNSSKLKHSKHHLLRCLSGKVININYLKKYKKFLDSGSRELVGSTGISLALKLRHTATGGSHSFIQQHLLRLPCAWHRAPNNQHTTYPLEQPYS